MRHLFWPALRSGVKRYPRAIVDSLRGKRRQNHDPAHEDISHLVEHDLAAAWLGHASVMLRIAGYTVLVDPVFSHRIGMNLAGRTIGLERVAPLPVHPDKLPRIDLILITHAHFDHLDRPTLRELAHADTTVITPARTGRLIPRPRLRRFKQVIELASPRMVQWSGLEIHAIRPAHWGARRVVDRARGFNSYLLKSAEHRALMAGDTAHTHAFDHLGPIDLAAMGIGAYDPWVHMHATPEQVWAMAQRMNARRVLPIHHSTFELGREHRDEPMRRLLQAAGDRADRIVQQPAGWVWSLDDEPRTEPDRAAVV